MENVPEVTRREIFDTFWKLSSFSEQNVFLCGLIVQQKPNVRRPRNSTRNAKSVSNSFRFQVRGNSVTVCKRFFLQTLQVSDGRMTRAIQKIREGQQPGSDGRGRHLPKNKTLKAAMNGVCDHIASFPSYQSHYSRSENPNRKYLPPDMNVRTMYELYKEKCTEKGDIPVSEAIYRRTYSNEFNLHFHQPLKDTCTRCDVLDKKIEVCEDEDESTKLKAEKELHLRKAEKVREARDRDTVKAREDKYFYGLTFDLEKALPFPVLTTSVAYYMRNTYYYNFGCHELGTGLGFTFCWDETFASRGSQEIGSCFVKHLAARASSAKHIVLYSDACTGQNRNIKFCLYLMKYIQGPQSNAEIIDHKFMVSGHSFLPNDSDFGSIELYAKNKLIYTADDWYSIILKCRRNNPFMLTKMGREDFKSVAKLENCITRRKKNENNSAVNWLKIQWIRILKDQPYTLFYKETLNEDITFSKLNLKAARSGRRHSLANVSQDVLYPRGRPVTEAKKKDMLDLLPYIPPVKHDFFVSLRTTIDEGEELVDVGPLEIVETTSG